MLDIEHTICRTLAGRTYDKTKGGWIEHDLVLSSNVFIKDIKVLTAADLRPPTFSDWLPYATNALESRKLPFNMCLAENVVFSTGACASCPTALVHFPTLYPCLFRLHCFTGLTLRELKLLWACGPHASTRYAVRQYSNLDWGTMQRFLLMSYRGSAFRLTEIVNWFSVHGDGLDQSELELRLSTLLKMRYGIYVALVDLHLIDGVVAHFITFDSFRQLLFIGGGRSMKGCYVAGAASVAVRAYPSLT